MTFFQRWVTLSGGQNASAACRNAMCSSVELKFALYALRARSSSESVTSAFARVVGCAA